MRLSAKQIRNLRAGNTIYFIHAKAIDVTVRFPATEKNYGLDFTLHRIQLTGKKAATKFTVAKIKDPERFSPVTVRSCTLTFIHDDAAIVINAPQPFPGQVLGDHPLISIFSDEATARHCMNQILQRISPTTEQLLEALYVAYNQPNGTIEHLQMLLDRATPVGAYVASSLKQMKPLADSNKPVHLLDLIKPKI